MDVNLAPKEQLLRVPGLGVRNVKRILSVRRYRRVRTEDLKQLNVGRRALHFLITGDANSRLRSLDDLRLEDLVAPAEQQLDIFATAASARSGEL